MFMCPAVHILSRALRRSSSTHEPSDPPFRVIFFGFSQCWAIVNCQVALTFNMCVISFFSRHARALGRNVYVSTKFNTIYHNNTHKKNVPTAHPTQNHLYNSHKWAKIHLKPGPKVRDAHPAPSRHSHVSDRQCEVRSIARKSDVPAVRPRVPHRRPLSHIHTHHTLARSRANGTVRRNSKSFEQMRARKTTHGLLSGTSIIACQPTHNNNETQISNPASGGCFLVTLMILPQVHLRKPCYDFYFL